MLTAVIRPQIKIPVSLASAGALATLVAEVMHHACKIPPPAEEEEDAVIAFDDETLKWVTALQLEAKIYFARAGTQYPEVNLEVCDRVRRTVQLLPRALTPLAVFIDQIGRFILQEQMFIPVPNDVDDFIYGLLFNSDNASRVHFRSLMHVPQSGIRTSFTGPTGRPMYANARIEQRDTLLANGIINEDDTFTIAFLENPERFPYIGVVDFVPEQDPPAPLPFTEIVRRYAELEGRVSKKLANVFVEVDLSKGQGVESQIVFRQLSMDGTCVAWSPRVLRADALEMGAILGLGHPCPIGDRECAANLCTIDTTAGLENLANILTKKLR